MNKNLPVLITNPAKNDIIEITEYISADNAKAALKVNDLFQNAFEMLAEFPFSATSRPAIKDQSVRIYTIKKQFSIVYRVTETGIEILRVLTRYQDILSVLCPRKSRDKERERDF